MDLEVNLIKINCIFVKTKIMKKLKIVSVFYQSQIVATIHNVKEIQFDFMTSQYKVMDVDNVTIAIIPKDYAMIITFKSE